MLATPSPVPTPSIEAPIPTPSPSPTVYVVLDQATSGTSIWTILLAIAPFVVSLVALGGAVYTAKRTGDNTIAAEDRRHENQIRHDDLRWRQDAKSKAYFDLIGQATSAVEAAHHLASFVNHVGGNADPYQPRNQDMALQSIDQWNTARDKIGPLLSTIRAIGNPDIAVRVDDFMVLVSSAIGETSVAAAAAAAGTGPKEVEAIMQPKLDNCTRAQNDLIEAVRIDLGIDPA